MHHCDALATHHLAIQQIDQTSGFQVENHMSTTARYRASHCYAQSIFLSFMYVHLRLALIEGGLKAFRYDFCDQNLNSVPLAESFTLVCSIVLI